MPYYHCDNSMVWISKAGADQIDELTNTIINYFNSLIGSSVQHPFDYDIWHSKLHELRSKLDEDLLSVIDWLWGLEFDHPLYYGTIHGDLTLTNLLISEDNGLEINAIDFLDVFIESVILDICKWRQDTAHFWTLTIVENKSDIDMNRVKLMLTHIDNKIESFINNNDILREYYLPFQILNLLRILPYNKDDRKVQDYLKAEVIRLYDGRTNPNHSRSRKIDTLQRIEAEVSPNIT